MIPKILTLVLLLSFVMGITAAGLVQAHGDHGNWRTDPRRPAAWPTKGGDPGNVTPWHDDHRRPAWWPWGVGERAAVSESPKPEPPRPEPVSGKEKDLLDTGMLRLENVYFETDKAVLKPESHASLDEAGEILARWPELRVEIGGHTDSRGDDGYNLTLSERRANAVRDYLLANFSGINSNQLVAKGYGETQPIADNTVASGRAKNRRVELKVLNRNELRR